MDIYNFTTVKEFFLLGLSDLAEVHYPLFLFLAVIYQATLLGNCTILLAIVTEKMLHTPMYYFLANLSVLDIFCPSAIIPKMLENFLTEKQNISFVGCALQLYFLVALAGTEVFLLALMAYDQYVAICFPLCYTLITTKVCCAQLTAGTWRAGFLNSLLHTVFTFCLSFCKSLLVNQYYCDIPPVVALSCSFTYVAKMLVLVVGGIISISAFLITIISYIYIISTILKIVSRSETQSLLHMRVSPDCGLSVLWHNPIDLYACLFQSTLPSQDRLISMLYAIITPMINPIIYSLRNTKVKGALKKFYVTANIIVTKNLFSTPLRLNS